MRSTEGTSLQQQLWDDAKEEPGRHPDFSPSERERNLARVRALRGYLAELDEAA